MVAHLYYAQDSSQRLQFSTHPLPIHLLDGPAADLQALGISGWLTPLDRSSRMYSRCCSTRETPSVYASAWLGAERSLSH